MNTLITVLVIAAVILVAIGKARPRRKRSARKEPKRSYAEKAVPQAPSKLDEFLGTNSANEEEATKAAVPYRDKFRLLNNTELALYSRLVEAVPAMLVFSQVSMSQLFHIRGNGRHAQLNEIGRKSVDFVICRRDDTSIVAALEFNGPIHNTEEKQRSDQTKRAALEAAGIPLLVIAETPLPSVDDLRRLLAPLILARKQREHERDVKLHRKHTATGMTF